MKVFIKFSTSFQIILQLLLLWGIEISIRIQISRNERFMPTIWVQRHPSRYSAYEYDKSKHTTRSRKREEKHYNIATLIQQPNILSSDLIMIFHWSFELHAVSSLFWWYLLSSDHNCEVNLSQNVEFCQMPLWDMM